MLTGELRSQIDGIWNSFWPGGISSPLEVMEQLTYLLFLKRLDDLQTLEENKANRLGEPVTRTIFPEGDEDRHRRAERPVPHPPPHHPAHGRDDGADPHRRDLRPSCRDLRIPRRRRRVHPRPPPRSAARPEAEPALPRGDVQRLRLRQHHAAHRQHEHAPPRRRAPRCPLQGFPGRGARSRDRGLFAALGEPALRRFSRLRERRQDLQQVVKTKKAELLFLALFLRLLKPGGRAAVIVPDGVLFGSTKAHKELRRILVEDQRLDGIVKLPSGVFEPYAGVSTAIVLFTKTNSGGTDHVWFYDLQADGRSLYRR